MARQRTSHDEVVRVTTARLSHSEDIAVRERRYALTQAVRLACLVLAVLLPVPVFVKLLLLVGAVVLPWFGVVMANGGPSIDRRRSDALLEGHAAEPLPEQPLRLAIEPGRVIDAER